MLPSSTFRFADLLVQLSGSSRLVSRSDLDREFSDHMLEVEWTVDNGWGTPYICPLHSLSLHPAAQVMHYAIELFEDMKAYRGIDDRIRLFRPDRHIHRMLRSIRRTALPEFDAEEFQNCLLKLVGVDKQWVPPATVGSLLVRSAVISTDASLQVTVPKKALLYVIMSQAETDFTPLSLLAEARYIRVMDGVWGCTKMGANYAPTITVQQEAAIEHSCHEVLWLHGPRRHLTHAGDMNIFMLWTSADGKKELLTPSTASGVILPGVTRDSLLRLARNWGEFEVTERMFTIDEVSQAVKQGRMQEMFGCCAEYGVRPITEIVYDGDRLTMPPMSTEASITARLHVQLSDIQCGRIPSEWVTDVEGHL